LSDPHEKDLANPHDRFFKEVFSRPEMAADFLANYLPSDLAGVLDLTRPELVKGSFVDVELRHHFSDLLYRVRTRAGPEAFVYVLFEHKSAPDEWVAFQLLRYIVRIWEPMARQRSAKLPPILPLVLYHGTRKWNVPTNFAAIIGWKRAEPLRRYAPDFQYLVCDLTEYKADEIRGAVVLRVALLAMKYVFSRDPQPKVTEILTVLRRLLSGPESALEYIRTVLFYFSAASKGMTADVLRAAIRTTLPEQEGWIMSTLAETWIKEGRAKGHAEGRAEGRKQGMQEGVAALTLRQLERRLGKVNAQIRGRVNRLPLERLEELGVALLDFDTSKDLTAWLAKQRRGSA
jgi:predicted transposase YdaD